MDAAAFRLERAAVLQRLLAQPFRQRAFWPVDSLLHGGMQGTGCRSGIETGV